VNTVSKPPLKDAMSVSLYLIIGQKSCNMFSILNKLTLRRDSAK